jgi:hypothetical protein
MTDPITPPPELVHQWAAASPLQIDDETYGYEVYIARHATQWGADQELEACCEWLVKQGWFSADEHEAIEELRAARRPKPPSLKQQAKQALGRFNANAHTTADQMQSDFDLLRCAIESLPDNTAPGE